MKQFLLTAVALTLGLSLFAQDPHWTQYNASPLTLNPATAGKIACDLQGFINYRSQWADHPAPFSTMAAGVEYVVGRKNQELNGNLIGFGLHMMADKAGDGGLTDNSVSLTVAYHQQLAEGTFLSAGFQGGFVSRKVDENKLVFPSEIRDGGVTKVDFIDKLSENFADLSGGLHFSSLVSDKVSVQAGGAWYHITEPNETFYQNIDSSGGLNKRKSRYVAHINATFAASDYVSFTPNFLYMSQGSAMQINPGITMGYNLDNANVYFGLYHRLEDAVNLLFGMEIEKVSFGVSYDVNVSGVGSNSFELSMAYSDCTSTKRKIDMCPRF